MEKNVFTSDIILDFSRYKFILMEGGSAAKHDLSQAA
jgi:hypothetical protein